MAIDAQAIFDAVNRRKFEIVVNADDETALQYRSLGFVVLYYSPDHFTVSWLNPTLTPNHFDTFNKLTAYPFTAPYIYLLMVNGRDVRHLTTRVVINKLKKEKTITDFAALDDWVVAQLCIEPIALFCENNVTPRLVHGVLTLRELNSAYIFTRDELGHITFNASESSFSPLVTPDKFVGVALNETQLTGTSNIEVKRYAQLRSEATAPINLENTNTEQTPRERPESDAIW